MKKLRSLICPFLAAGLGCLLLGVAMMSCPLTMPEWVWAAPIASGFIVMIFAFGRRGAINERRLIAKLRLQDD